MLTPKLIEREINLVTMNHEINLMQKQARAQVIARYLTSIGRKSCVCYTCGNAGKALRATGLQVRQIINPQRWYTYTEIQQLHNRFDATSGHLSTALMAEVAAQLAGVIGKDDYWRDYFANAIKAGVVLEIPTGSGETLVTLKMIYPVLKVLPAYNTDESTAFNPRSPLNALVLALANEHNTR